MTVDEFLNSETDVLPVRKMAYGPVVGEHHDAAMFGPDRNPLGKTDVAASPDTGLGQGDLIMAEDGTLHTVADWSYLHPNQPTHGTIEFRDRQDQGRGFIKKVNSVDDFLGLSQKADGTTKDAPAGASTVSSVDGFLGIQKPREILPTSKVVPTASEQSTLEAPEGSPQREEINKSVAGNLFAPPGKFARDPTLSELVSSALPRSVQESQREAGRIPLAPPLPEQGAFEQGGVLGVTIPAVEAGGEMVRAMMPHDWRSYLAQIYPPMAAGEIGGRLAQGDISDIPLVGRIPEIAAADDTPAFSKERYMTALRTLMDVGALAGAGEGAPSRLRTEPLVPEPPPTQSMGPGTIAGDVSRALAERRGVMVPEPPPDIAPAPTIEETIAQSIRKAPDLPVDPDVTQSLAQRILAQRVLTPDVVRRFAERAEPMPVEVPPEPVGPVSETAVEKAMRTTSPQPLRAATELEAPSFTLPEIPGVTRPPIEGPEQPAPVSQQRVVPSETAIMPGAEAALRARKAKIEASIAPSRAIGQRTVYDAELEKLNGQLGVPPEAPVNRPEGAALASEMPGGVQVPLSATAVGTNKPYRSAALRYPGGETVEAPSHAQALAQSPYASEAGFESGFVTHDGKFVPYTGEVGAVPEAPEETGITKTAIAGQREARELPAIERQKQIDFGESLDRAKATLAQDPLAGHRLVEELTAKPRSVTPEDTPLLIERMQQVQREFDAANRAVNKAAPEALEVAKARLEHARAEYDKTVTATQNATSRTGAGLNSVKMILNEDYSLARMESRKRAANNGKISEEQVKHTEALHARITEASNGLDGLEQLRRGVKQEAKSGKRFTDIMNEQAQKARERLIAKRGRLNAGIDPTNLVDEAIIGASHIANGLTKFADWSAQMVRDFGDRIKPFLKDLWDRARTYHDASVKASRSPEEIRLERYKTQLAKDTAGVTAKIQRGDFTKPTRQQLVLDKAAYKMKGNLQRLKNEFERGVAKDAYNKMSPGDKFWQHFVGVERAMKLSSPGVFEKLGLAAAVREVLAPVEAAGGYAASKVFPKLAKGTRYGADLGTITRAELKAKASLFSEGMKDSYENLKGKETGLEAMSDKYGRQPDFWYNRIGKIHAAVKAPVKRAEFIRSLEHRMDAAAKAGEDINHPEVMDRLATESALDANRAIFQQNTVVSHFFSMLDKAHPAAGRTARFLFPVVKIPVNLFKEFVTYNVGGPVAAARIGHAYWKGVETLEPAAREAIIRQLVKGSAGGAAILWGYYNNEKVHDFFAKMPTWFEHTPIAMAIHEGSIIKGLKEQGTGTKYRPTEAYKDATKMAKYDIPFAYTVTGLTNALDPSNPNGWRDYLYGMIQSSVVPQGVSWTAKEMDKPTPFNPLDKPTYRPPTNIVEAITQGIPGLRQDIPEYHSKKQGGRKLY